MYLPYGLVLPLSHPRERQHVPPASFPCCWATAPQRAVSSHRSWAPGAWAGLRRTPALCLRVSHETALRCQLGLGSPLGLRSVMATQEAPSVPCHLRLSTGQQESEQSPPAREKTRSDVTTTGVTAHSLSHILWVPSKSRVPPTLEGRRLCMQRQEHREAGSLVQLLPHACKDLHTNVLRSFIRNGPKL